MIVFEPAVAADADAIHTLFVACGRDLLSRGLHHWENAPHIEQIRAEIDRGQSWVGRLDDEVVATFVITATPPDDPAGRFWTDEPGALYIRGLGVHPAHQHQGLGLKCARFIERHARERGAGRLRFDSTAADERLVAFYREFGCVEVGRVDGGDEICFEYAL